MFGATVGKILCIFACLACVVVSHSDEFGRNPQHDFGSVAGRVTNPVLPFWTMLGDAFANEDVVRLTPDRQSKTGAVWNSQRLMWDNWEVMVSFNVHGVSPLGADGFAFWLAREVNVLGKFFGFVENFHGIGVIVDTYDNDGTGQHPMVSVLQNSGEKSYEHHHEGGKHHGGEMELGHCSFSLRNQKQHTLMRITYQGKTLTVNVKKEDSPDWTLCASAPNVEIEKGLYLGLSAATGHLADNHDILGVSVRNLDPDAQYFDSEQRFAQFSKYTIAESLGRIQADIRGSLYSLASTSSPVHSSSKPTQAASHNEDGAAILGELASLKRELGSVVNSIEKFSGNQRPASSSQSNDVRELREIQNSLKGGVNDLSGETQKISNIHAKLERIILNLENMEKSRFRSKDESADQEKSDLSFFFYFLFFVFFLAALYVVFLFYRAKTKPSFQKMV